MASNLEMTNRPKVLRTRTNNPLTEDDRKLLELAMDERNRLYKEEREIRERLEQILRERKQLTIKSLAAKFECSKYHIASLIDSVRGGGL